jgi:hypothetical protein
MDVNSAMKMAQNLGVFEGAGGVYGVQSESTCGLLLGGEQGEPTFAEFMACLKTQVVETAEPTADVGVIAKDAADVENGLVVANDVIAPLQVFAQTIGFEPTCAPDFAQLPEIDLTQPTKVLGGELQYPIPQVEDDDALENAQTAETFTGFIQVESNVQVFPARPEEYEALPEVIGEVSQTEEGNSPQVPNVQGKTTDTYITSDVAVSDVALETTPAENPEQAQAAQNPQNHEVVQTQITHEAAQLAAPEAQVLQPVSEQETVAEVEARTEVAEVAVQVPQQSANDAGTAVKSANPEVGTKLEVAEPVKGETAAAQVAAKSGELEIPQNIPQNNEMPVAVQVGEAIVANVESLKSFAGGATVAKATNPQQSYSPNTDVNAAVIPQSEQVGGVTAAQVQQALQASGTARTARTGCSLKFRRSDTRDTRHAIVRVRGDAPTRPPRRSDRQIARRRLESVGADYRRVRTGSRFAHGKSEFCAGDGRVYGNHG